MGDAIDDAFVGDEEEEEMEVLINHILDEIGININLEWQPFLIFYYFFSFFRRDDNENRIRGYPSKSTSNLR
ncbi:hypothetical protein Lal_00031789 [Lupinus albus]|nr:hypothetical protein Lal_00031789 [Lupinus albus]